MIMQWTQDNDERLRAYFNTGLDDKHIGMEFGCSHIVIKRRRHQLRLLRQECSARMFVPPAPVEPVAGGSRIDALFRAAERPSKAGSTYRQQPPPSLMSRGESMT